MGSLGSYVFKMVGIFSRADNSLTTRHTLCLSVIFGQVGEKNPESTRKPEAAVALLKQLGFWSSFREVGKREIRVLSSR